MAKILILLGPPGSGKGTQAKLLIQRKEGVAHISTGDLFRSEIASASELGKLVEETIRKGSLVSDEITNQIFYKQINLLHIKNPTNKVYILDGYPRTAPQADFLRKMSLSEDSFFEGLLVAELDVSEDEVIRRISGRLINPRLGIVYHKTDKTPKKEGFCDEDGGELIQREDDNPKTVRERYEIYRTEVDGIVTQLGTSKEFYKIEAMRPPEEVYSELSKLLK